MKTGYAVLGGAVAVLALAGGAYFYGQWQYRSGVSHERQRATIESLQSFVAESEKLAGLAEGLQGKIDQLAASRPKIIERYIHAKEAQPLPAGCIIDPVRLRHINAAIGQANAAIEHIGAVPQDPRPGN